MEPLKSIAKSQSMSNTTIMLRWFLQQKVVRITTTTNVACQQGHGQALDVELTKDETDEMFRAGNIVCKHFYVPDRYAKMFIPTSGCASLSPEKFRTERELEVRMFRYTFGLKL